MINLEKARQQFPNFDEKTERLSKAIAEKAFLAIVKVDPQAEPILLPLVDAAALRFKTALFNHWGSKNNLEQAAEETATFLMNELDKAQLH